MSEKVWFITGASRGFGRIWAEGALERGDKVVATARSVDSLSGLVEKYGDAVLPLALDVTKREQVEEVIPLLRRFTPGESSQIDEEVWSGDGRLSLRRSLGTSLISEVVIGMGASIGREAAPKLMGGVSGSVLATWAALSPPQRRLLVGLRGGAGLAAVYNVPLGGALFTAEILCGSVNLPVVLPALACSFTATAVAWVYLPDHATYMDIPGYHITTTLLVCAVLMGPVVGVVSSAYVRLIGWASHHRPHGRASIGAPLVALGPGADRHRLPTAVRQRPGLGSFGLPRSGWLRLAVRPVHLEACGNGVVRR